MEGRRGGAGSSERTSIIRPNVTRRVVSRAMGRQQSALDGRHAPGTGLTDDRGPGMMHWSPVEATRQPRYAMVIERPDIVQNAAGRRPTTTILQLRLPATTTTAVLVLGFRSSATLVAPPCVFFMSRKAMGNKTVADSKGEGGGAAAPYWPKFFFKKPPFPCKRHIVRCVHLE